MNNADIKRNRRQHQQAIRRLHVKRTEVSPEQDNEPETKQKKQVPIAGEHDNVNKINPVATCYVNLEDTVMHDANEVVHVVVENDIDNGHAKAELNNDNADVLEFDGNSLQFNQAAAALNAELEGAVIGDEDQPHDSDSGVDENNNEADDDSVFVGAFSTTIETLLLLLFVTICDVVVCKLQ